MAYETKIKQYLKTGALLFGLSFVVINCQKEDDNEIIFTKQKPKLNIELVSLEHLVSTNPNLIGKISPLKKTKYASSESQRVDSEVYDFSINEEQVQIIALDSFTTYTFMVNREEVVPFELENYTLKVNANGTYEQYLLKYYYTEDEQGNRVYNTNTLDVELIEDNALIFRASCTPEFVEVLDTITCTFNERCTGPGQHEVGDECLCTPSPTTCDPAGSTTCVENYVWTYQGCSSGNDNTIDNDEDNSTDVGGNTEPDTDEEEEKDDVPAIPLDDELGLKRECKKITNFLEDSNNATFKQKLLDLASPTNYTQNLDVEFEKSISSFENTSTLDERQGNASQAAVEILVNPPNKYKAFVHTHPNDSIGTYSVFSFDDLKGISKILANNKLDTGTFVAFLITKKGDSLTYYAMTIHNKKKFEDFFYSYQSFNFLTATQEEKDKKISTHKKETKLRIKYYEHATNPRINKVNVDREQMLTEFLSFINEADLGVTMFETDENFNTFSKIKPSINGLERKPCNN